MGGSSSKSGVGCVNAARCIAGMMRPANPAEHLWIRSFLTPQCIDISKHIWFNPQGLIDSVHRDSLTLDGVDRNLGLTFRDLISHERFENDYHPTDANPLANIIQAGYPTFASGCGGIPEMPFALQLSNAG